MIDVRDFLKTHSVEELNRSAETYFARLTDWTYLLAKPFAAPEDCAKLLIEFWATLQGLELCSRMKVLDFGPGSCWSSHFLTQMGCKVYACDISPSALEIGKKRYQDHPPFGTQPVPEFLVYDGFRFPLPDRSIDRVLCMHALHHVPNVSHVIGEMSRVLGDYGVAAFAEPGPDHSKGAIAQQEIENGVLENDIVVEDIWGWARAAGFQRIELGAFPIDRVALSLEEYRNFCAGDPEIGQRVLAPVRTHAIETRTFSLYKNADPVTWSTTTRGLAAELNVRISGRNFQAGQIIHAQAACKNIGQAAWFMAGEGPGTVRLGFHLKNLYNGEYIHDYGRASLASHPLWPGGRADSEVEIRAPLLAGRYELTCDLVSEYVCWFAEQNRSTAAVFEIRVA